MNRYIFFRTDRIGDFLLSAILIKSIKRNDPSGHITVVTSQKNYNFVKTFKYVDNTILYPEKLFDRFKFFLNLKKNKYYLSCVMDGKKRSIYANILLNSNIKIICTYKTIHKFLFGFFFKKTLVDSEYSTKLNEIKAILKILNYNFEDSDLNLLSDRNYEHDKIYKFLINKKNFILFHLDEKWIYDHYIKSYTNIEPETYIDLLDFFKQIVNKSNNTLVITSGNINNKFTDIFKNKFLNIDKDIFNFYNYNIFFLNSLSINQLEFIISQCSSIISCHGAPTHIAAAYNKKIIDIVDNSEKFFFIKWSSHFRNYEQLNRTSFKSLSNIILTKL